MSCPYYWYNHNYACRKSGKDVNEDIYYKYCRNYDYDDCPIYKGNDSSGCFLTSACTKARGLPDDCEELQILRHFRDGYMRSLPEGPDEIIEYYHKAPMVVETINSRPDAQAIFDRIYNELVLPCISFIKSGQLPQAHTLYRAYSRTLFQTYMG